MIKNTTNNQKLGWVLFISYLVLLVYFLFFAESMGRTQTQDDYSYNLELFKEIKRFYVYRHQIGLGAFVLNVFGNVAAFIPCGFFLPIISRRSKKWYNTVLISFLFSLMVELIQLVSKVGSFDVDDLLLNTLGGVIGFILYKLIQTYRIRRKRRAKAKQ